MPGTDIPTLDVFWSEEGTRRKDIIKIGDIFNVEVIEVTEMSEMIG